MGALVALQQKLSPKGDTISDQARELTIQVFGAPLAPSAVVANVCQRVQQEGLAAVCELTRKLDRVEITPKSFRVSTEEMAAAHEQASPEFLDAIRHIRHNIVEFQSGILHSNVELEPAAGVQIRHRYTPLERVGVCVPGGAAAYPSSLLMAAIPAQVAGVKEVAVVAPPTPFGSYNPHLLAACHEIGIREVYRVGGAQAIAALAFGVEGLRPVDKIVGPGNLYVALAKKQVYGHVDIDSIAGPSEVLVIADETSRPEWVALDLISQAEHYPGAAILVSWCESLLNEVRRYLVEYCPKLERGNLAAKCLSEFGAMVLVDNSQQAITFANQIAPEHLHIQCLDETKIADSIHNAGAIFVGSYTPVAVGDYIAGPSHVLPTGATARWASGLSCNQFLRSHAVIRYDQTALTRDASALKEVAVLEGLTGHWQSVAVRIANKG
ncbi:MAG: histidinol dehydrogenase [Planctomycetaceae bacterium]|nr:histidinol dehydrogenase [Planctomycetaceae bacterium]